MKKIILAVTLLTLAFSFSTAQKTAPIKKVEVTAATIASLPAGQVLDIDLTQNGTIYEVAAGIDYSRLRVRNSTGKMALSDLVRRQGLTGKLLLGTYSDLSAVDFGFPAGGTLQLPTEAKCSGGLCTCNGPKDCRDMNKAGWCLAKSRTCCKGCGDSPNKWGCNCAAKKV